MPSNDDTAITTTATTTTEKILTPFQAQRVLLIGRLRELVVKGHSPLAIQAELGISQRQYYRLYQKAFEHDCKLIEQWDSETLREDLAIYMARLQKILAFLMDKMEDSNAHDIIRVKAAQLATELSNAIYRTSREGVLQVRSHAQEDMGKWSYSFPFKSYLMEKGSIPEIWHNLRKHTVNSIKRKKERTKQKVISL